MEGLSVDEIVEEVLEAYKPLKAIQRLGKILCLLEKKYQITNKHKKNYQSEHTHPNCPFREDEGIKCYECEVPFCFMRLVENDVIAHRSKIAKLEKIGQKLLKEVPLWEDWLRPYVKGVGHGLTLRLLGWLDFDRAKHPSSFWAYAGYTTEARKKQKYNHTLKGVCVRQAMSFLGIRRITPAFIANPTPRLDGGYARFFKMVRNKANEKYPDWTRRHKLMHSMAVMMKLYLAHLFIVQNFMENNIAAVHYAVAHLGEDYIYMPVIDNTDEPPRWWDQLAEEYRKMKVKPVRI